MNINLTFREEILILTLIYFLALVTIPVIMLTKNNNNKITKFRLHESFEDQKLRSEYLINSISTFESNNRIRNSTQIDFFDLIYLPMFELKEKLMKVDIKVIQKHPRRFMKKTWKRFTYANNNSTLKSSSLQIPLRIDWRNETNVISQVEKQTCGDCFDVAIVETIESMFAIKSGKLMNLSIEQMDECNDLGMGCDGGNPVLMLQWLLNANDGKIMTREKFHENNKSCNTAKVDDSSIVKVKDYSYNDFSGHEELMLLFLAYQGPLIAEINALPIIFYKNEDVVFDNCDGNLNHVVQIVGYDLTAPIPFYIVRNSWGKDFGINGYFKLAIGKNICGVAKGITTIIV